ncbi:unnamed protein product [Tuwongella immobilis]|uniref:Uncharacterized protein n=1 Tax=Tuwongella immobilis TaxID=692036 RepID=A0A6C2YKA0_9BACT|nr:unnamed protein product [Tuwongella immobilis]VTR98149.1 unnamed protein product [Tuwongella immobilis]
MMAGALPLDPGQGNGVPLAIPVFAPVIFGTFFDAVKKPPRKCSSRWATLGFPAGSIRWLSPPAPCLCAGWGPTFGMVIEVD